MCGIAVTFARSADAPPVDRGALERCRDRMSPRGPDGKGIWISPDGRVGLAHRRLSILDLSEVIRAAGIGEAVNPKNPEELKGAMVRMLRNPPKGPFEGLAKFDRTAFRKRVSVLLRGLG